jgi:hypothetical protein
MLLTTVPYYRIPRDEDGRPSRNFDRLFEMALRWHGDIEIPDDMISASSKRKGEEPVHAGAVALHNLRDANDISQRQLNAAFAYLRDMIAFFEGNPWEGFEPYPGRNKEAATDLRELLAALSDEAVDVLIIDPPDDLISRWTVQGDLREIIDLYDDSTNHIVATMLVNDGWSPTQIDSEFSCFFGYADSEVNAATLRDEALVMANKLANRPGNIRA